MTAIPCEIHDYIEIACLYGFEIELSMKIGMKLQGRALTTETSPEKKEWLLLDKDGVIEKIELGEITSMTAITSNPHFTTIDFSAQD